MMGAQQHRAFVLMPFDDEFNDVFEKLIKLPLEEQGFIVERADSTMTAQNIMKDVVQGIWRADLIIADLTNSNSNVFYELGIVHGLSPKKTIPTVLLTQAIDDVPFDLRSYRLVRYSTHFARAGAVITALRQIAQEVKANTLGVGNPVSDFLAIEGAIESPVPAIQRPDENSAEIPSDEAVIENSEEAELGLLDYMMDFETSLDDVTAQVTRIGSHANEMTAKMTEALAKVGAPDGFGPPNSATRKHWVTKALSKELDTFAKLISEETGKLARSWDRFDNGSEWVVKLPVSQVEEATPEEKAKMHSAVVNLIRAIDPTMESVDKLIVATRTSLRSLEGLRGISKDMNRATKHSAEATRHLLETYERGQALMGRFRDLLISLIDKRLS